MRNVATKYFVVLSVVTITLILGAYYKQPFNPDNIYKSNPEYSHIIYPSAVLAELILAILTVYLFYKTAPIFLKSILLVVWLIGTFLSFIDTMQGGSVPAIHALWLTSCLVSLVVLFIHGLLSSGMENKVRLTRFPLIYFISIGTIAVILMLWIYPVYFFNAGSQDPDKSNSGFFYIILTLTEALAAAFIARLFFSKPYILIKIIVLITWIAGFLYIFTVNGNRLASAHILWLLCCTISLVVFFVISLPKSERSI